MSKHMIVIDKETTATFDGGNLIMINQYNPLAEKNSVFYILKDDLYTLTNEVKKIAGDE